MSASAHPPALLAHWSWTTGPGPWAPAHVIPDGCVDLIRMERAGERPVWFVSRLTDHTYLVRGTGPVRVEGHRLRPGAIVPADALLECARRWGRDGEPADVWPLLDACTRRDPHLEEALAALAAAPSVAAAARGAGVSARTLSRRVREQTGRPPVFWHRLARVRRAARALPTPGASLCDLAFSHGYADQAHFSRECRAWLGQSPGRLRHHPEILSALNEPGYAT